MYVNRLILVGKVCAPLQPYRGGIWQFGLQFERMALRVLVQDDVLLRSLMTAVVPECTVVVEGKVALDGDVYVAFVSADRGDDIRVIVDADGYTVGKLCIDELANDLPPYEQPAARHEAGQDTGAEDGSDRHDEVIEHRVPPARPDATVAQPVDATPVAHPTEPPVAPVVQTPSPPIRPQASQAPAPTPVVPQRAMPPGRGPVPGRTAPMPMPSAGTPATSTPAAPQRPPPRLYQAPPNPSGGRPAPTSPGRDAIDDDIPF